MPNNNTGGPSSIHGASAPRFELQAWLIKCCQLAHQPEQEEDTAAVQTPSADDWERSVRRQIEPHFRNMKIEAERCDRLRAEFAEHQPKAEVYVKTSGHADRTLNTLVRLEHDCRSLFGWRDVVKCTMKHFHGTPIGTVLHERYVNKRSAGAICHRLCLSQTTYYEYLRRAMYYAGMVAAAKHLLKL